MKASSFIAFKLVFDLIQIIFLCIKFKIKLMKNA